MGYSEESLHTERYERQIMLPEWGIETQEKLKQAEVFVAGAGGLGCPAALNLALAGVGKIRICDFDVVEVSNLNRQFLHAEGSVGADKAESARKALSSINSEVNVEAISHKITNQNVDDVVADAHIIIDCLDNFAARYALNQCAIRKNIPMIHGAIWGFEGRVTFLYPPSTPCLKCIFPQAPSEEASPVVGAAACATGSTQALEAIKHLINVGSLLEGRMLILDFSAMHIQELEISADSQCPDCGQLQ